MNTNTGVQKMTNIPNYLKNFNEEVLTLKNQFKEKWIKNEFDNVKRFIKEHATHDDNSIVYKWVGIAKKTLPSYFNNYFLVKDCFEDGTIKEKRDFKPTWYKRFIIKNDESLMQIITAKADTYANEVFDFYLTRVSEKVKDVNDASEIQTFELKNVQLGGRSYPETVIKVKTLSDAEAEISTTVETHFSNRGTFFLKFPTRFHNMKKSGNPVKAPSWNNFVELARECA